MTDTHTTAHIPDEAVKAMPERIYAAKSDRPCIVCMDEKFRDYDVEYVRADVAAAHLSAPCAVEVKKLEWGKYGERGFKAETALGRYTILMGAVQCYRLDYPDENTEFYDTHEEAKAAAQADFEARILSCVVTKPVDVAAVREALRFLLDVQPRIEGNEPFNGDQSKWNDYCDAIHEAERALSAEPAQGDHIADVGKMVEALKETRIDLVVLSGNIADAAKSSDKWEGMYDRVRSWIDRIDAALPAAPTSEE